MLGGQAARSARYDNMLPFVDRFYGPPKNFFYGGGGAWYFGLNKYADQFTTRTDVTKDEVLEGMSLSIGTYESERRFASIVAKLGAWGLKVMAYEIGGDTSGTRNLAAKKAASLDPQIAPLMKRFYDAFRTQGGDAAMWFRLGADSVRQASTASGP